MVVLRRNSRIDRFRSYVLYVDGEFCGRIKNNSKIKVNLPEGKHILYLSIDWCKSNEFIIYVEKNNEMFLECYPRNDGKSFFKNLFSFITNPSQYIVLDWNTTI